MTEDEKMGMNHPTTNVGEKIPERIHCSECDAPVTMSLVSSRKFVRTEKGYEDSVKRVGERVEARLGLACDCTEHSSWEFRRDALESGSFEEKPEKFPERWVDVDAT